MNLEEGKRLIKVARDAINSKDVKFISNEKKGVFVTLYSFPEKKLRGCIGFIEPFFKVDEAVYRAAIGAAFHDPRFKPINKDEKYIVEVSVLTRPKILEENYLKNIKKGKDGLIVEKNGKKGVLLPKVAVDFNFDVKKFLENTCLKAGLNKEEWKNKDCRVYTFQTEVFCEESPNGKIRKVL